MLDQLGDNFSTALILNPVLDADLLMKAIAMEFGIKVKGMDRLETIASINAFLLNEMEHDRVAVNSLLTRLRIWAMSCWNRSDYFPI